jgi:hypothetical protein
MRLNKNLQDFAFGAGSDSEGRVWCTCTLCRQNKEGGRFVSERTRRQHLAQEKAPAVNSQAGTSTQAAAAAGPLQERELPAGGSPENQANLLAADVEFGRDEGLGADTVAGEGRSSRPGRECGHDRANIGSWFNELPDFETADADDCEHDQGEEPGRAGRPVQSDLNLKLLDALIDLQKIGEKGSLSNEVMDQLLKNCIGASDSFAAAIDPRWRDTIQRLDLPQSHDQVGCHV